MSYYQIGESIKSKRRQINTLNDEIATIEDKLADTNTGIGKYRMNLSDSIVAQNEIASKKIQIRLLEEEINECQLQRKTMENYSFYKLRISLDSYHGHIVFTCKTKGQYPDKPFIYNGNELRLDVTTEQINELSWVKHGEKAIGKSFVRIFDKEYVLHENGNFICISKNERGDTYNEENVIGNVLDLIKSA